MACYSSDATLSIVMMHKKKQNKKAIIQFLLVLAVQCGSVLRDSAQISTYCMPRCLVGEAWPEQPVTGDTERPRKRRSMEGSRGFRRLTGQKAEPP